MITTDASDLEYFWDREMASVVAPEFEVLNGVQVWRVPVRHMPFNRTLFAGLRRTMGSSQGLFAHAGIYRAFASVQPWLPDLKATIEELSPFDVIHGTNVGLEGPAITANRLARTWDTKYVLIPFIHLGSSRSASAHRYVTMPHQRELFQTADLILTMTEMERAFLIELGINPQKTASVGAGIHLQDVTGGDANAFRKKFQVEGHLIASIGTLAQEKGTFTLVRAVRRLRAAGLDITLVLVGPAMTQFSRWYHGLPASDREGIILAGIVSPDEKRDILAAMDLLVLASRTESFGIVYLEAWANKKPVIAASVGAVPEIVHLNQNGLLVPFDDEMKLASGIRHLIEHPEFAAQLGECGFLSTAANHTWKAVTDRVTRAYEKMLGYSIC